MGLLLLVAALASGREDGWLARHQDASGAWMVDGEADVGATGLSLLAFLGAGYTDRNIKQNRYARHVRRGLKFLIDHPGKAPRDRAIATLAMCEAYWQTRNPRYKLPAEKGLALLDGGDDPITRALVVAALKSGRFGGLAVPEERLERERAWLDEHAGENPAAALFSRILLAPDRARDDERNRQAIKLLLRENPRDPFGWYFATTGAFQLGGSAWRKWNDLMKKRVVRAQRPDGSWNGQVAATALYVMCLEVYYRYDRVFGVGAPPRAEPEPRGRSSLPPLTSRIQLDGGDELDLERVSAEVRVEGFRARVRLSFDFFHDGDDPAEGTFQLRLPDGASPHALGFGSGAKKGVDAPFRMKAARMVERRRARDAYTSITSERRDPALLEWNGAGVFTTRVFPLEPKKLHRVEIGYDVDVPPGGEFELVLPATRRAPGRRVARAGPAASTMTGGGYTAVRPADLPDGWTIEGATLQGCTDVLVAGRRVAARGEAVAGATLALRLRAGDETRAWSTTLPAPVASSLTPRVYGEIAVGQLEPFAGEGEGVPEAYARHFRVVRATCSLVMLESEADYRRFGIRTRDDAAVVRRVPAAPWLDGRRATPRQRLRWHLQTLGKPTDLLDHVPDSEFEGLPPGTDADLARTCEKLGRPRLGLVYDALAGGTRRGNLCARILRTEREGFWFEYARKALDLAGNDLVVLLWWDTDSDVDLHVVDPFGDVCNWRRPVIATAGRLAADRRHGSGPEIYRLARADPGEYVVRVNYFRPAGATRAHVVAIDGGEVTRGSVELTRRDEMVEVLRIAIRP